MKHEYSGGRPGPLANLAQFLPVSIVDSHKQGRSAVKLHGRRYRVSTSTLPQRLYYFHLQHPLVKWDAHFPQHGAACTVDRRFGTLRKYILRGWFPPQLRRMLHIINALKRNLSYEARFAIVMIAPGHANLEHKNVNLIRVQLCFMPESTNLSTQNTNATRAALDYGKLH